MSKSRHAAKPSRKRSAWIAAILLVVLGLASAGFWFVSSQSTPQPAPTPTITTPATPTPTVTPTPEPTPTPSPTPTLNENEISLTVTSVGTFDHDKNIGWARGYVNGSEELTDFRTAPEVYAVLRGDRTVIATVSYDEPDGVPLITALR